MHKVCIGLFSAVPVLLVNMVQFTSVLKVFDEMRQNQTLQNDMKYTLSVTTAKMREMEKR